jgi:hypothetical protein
VDVPVPEPASGILVAIGAVLALRTRGGVGTIKSRSIA